MSNLECFISVARESRTVTGSLRKRNTVNIRHGRCKLDEDSCRTETTSFKEKDVLSTGSTRYFRAAMGSLLYLSRLYKTRSGIRRDNTIWKHVVPREASYGEAEKSVAIPRGITKLCIAFARNM